MSALVTGGAGFIGRHVVAELLRRQQPVRVLDDLSRARVGSLDEFAGNPKFLGLINGDVTDKSVLSGAARDIDTIFHLAASVSVGNSVRAPSAAVHSNMLGMLTVLEVVRSTDLRLVHVSTCHVYASSTTPLDESSPTVPTSPYAASKLAAEALAHGYQASYGLRLTIIRPFNVYGPWQRHDLEGGVVAQFIGADISGNPIDIHGDGGQTRDFLYVGDCARGIVDAKGGNAVGEVINLATGTETKVAELAHLVATRPECIRHVAHPHAHAEIARYAGNAGVARRLLGWKPEVHLSDGLRQTRVWLEQYDASPVGPPMIDMDPGM